MSVINNLLLIQKKTLLIKGLFCATRFCSFFEVFFVTSVVCDELLTLRGKVLQIGGLKEKVLAAHRAGIRTVICPIENEKDLTDIPEDVRNDMEFKLVSTFDEVRE